MKNVIARSVTGILFVAVMVGAILWCKYSYLALMLLILIGCMLEFLKLTSGTYYKFSKFLTVTSGVILFLLTFAYKAYDIPGKLIMLAVLPVAIVMIDSLYVKDKTEYGKFANMYTSILYIAIPITMSSFAVFSHGEYSGVLLLCIFILIWSMDTFSYIFGMALSRYFPKKLSPNISPKKSWVGFCGGLFCTVGVAVLLSALGYLSMRWWVAALLGLLVGISGVYGDLLESQWKRYYEVKDSGHTLPGHGGFLDRFDSTLFAIPSAILFMEILKLL